MTMKAFLVDLDRCVGCYACIISCKDENNLDAGYDRISLNIIEGKDELFRFYVPEFNLNGNGSSASQCTMCPQLQAEARKPACVTNCLTDAILFDDLNIIKEAAKRGVHLKTVKQRKSTVIYVSSKEIPLICAGRM